MRCIREPTLAFAAATVLVSMLACTPSDPTAGAVGGVNDTLEATDWLASVQESIEASEYQLREAGEGTLTFANRAQGFRARFEADGGVVVRPRGGAEGTLRAGLDDWSVTMKTVAWGRPGTMVELESASARPGECGGSGRNDELGSCLRRAEMERAGLLEWWTNDERGLEQGWTVSEPPEGDGPLVLEVAVDGMAVEVGDLGDHATLAQGTSRLSYGGGVAWDATGRKIEVWLESGPSGLLVVVEDEGANFPVTVDPLLATAGWIADSGQAGAHLGISVSSAGDVDGDGYSDVVVGAPSYDNGQIDEGRAFLYPGSAAGLAPAASWTSEGDQAGALFGSSVSSAGDVDGDGYGDVLVGAPSFDNGESDEGRALLYLGSASGLSATAAWTAEPNQAGAALGCAVSGAGDVNGDGFGDVIVGAYQYADGQPGEGGAFVYEGSPSGLANTAAWVAESNQAGALLGFSVSSAGDVNGDGFGDVVVGADAYSNGETGEGGIFVFLGSTSGLSPSAAWTAESNQADADFGRSVSSAGDVNGDGYSEVLVGARYYDNGQNDEGRAFLYLGSASGLAATADWTAESDSSTAQFGGFVSMAGDVNGDGYGDIVVGAAGYEDGQNNEGGVFLYLGSASGLPTTPTWSAESNQADAYFGRAVGSAGDVNGDGFGDIVVGAWGFDGSEPDEGRAFLFYGSSAAPSPDAQLVQPDQADAQLGTSVASAGDVNGDGHDDILVGAPYFDAGETDEGVAFLYLGTATGVDPTPAWTVESNQADAHLGNAVSSAGDVNGDGYADALVGVFQYDDGEVDEGMALVFLGSATGLETVASWSVLSDQDGAELGGSVASAGDVDRDGYDDVVLGARLYDAPEANEGRAFLYLGSPSGLAANPTWIAESDQVSAHFGWAVASAGDVNGDGHADVVIGANAWDNGENDEGRADVYLGSPDGLEATPAWTAESDQDDARFGWSVGASDTNGDGFSDVVVGASSFDGGQANEGRAYAFLGSSTGVETTASWTTEPDVADAYLGRSISSAGDVNGDGFGDVVIGAYAWEDDVTDEGGAFLHLGSGSGLEAIPSWQVDTDQLSAHMGASVALAGDVNADGYSDLLVGAPFYDDGDVDEGGGFLFLGNGGDGTTSAFARLPDALQPATTTRISPGLTSTSTDTFDVTALGRSPFGRMGVKLEVEAKALGTPFDGTGLVTPATWTDSGLLGTTLQETINSLAAETSYHWRARVLFDPASAPPQLASPWMWGGQGGQPQGNHVFTACATDLDADGQCDSYDPDGDGDGETDDTDCDDADPSVYTGALEVADDNIDQDCNGFDTVTCFADTDGDTFGGPSTVLADDGDCDDAGEDATSTDCDDGEPTIHPGAAETCDWVDSDCDGDLADEFADFDADGLPDCIDDDDDGDGEPESTDCDDADPSIYPTAPEVPDDNIDQDCNGVDTVTCQQDTDGDTFGGLLTALADDGDCTDPGESPLDTDCDDTDASIFPGAPETCDSIDSDCDGSLLDEFTDTDADGEADCTDDDDDGDAFPDGVDCDPLDPAIYPNAPESCDAVDSDCDNEIVDGFDDTDSDGIPDCVDVDGDGDGHEAATDCDDADPAIYPGAPEITGDGIDQDCNGADTIPCFVDADGDGHGETGTLLADDGDCLDPGESNLDDDCDDTDPTSWPGAPETPDDGIDQDCDGADTVTCFVDADGDGFGGPSNVLSPDGDCTDAGESATGDDCDDAQAATHPGAIEACDAVDSDCDGDLVDGFDDTDSDGAPDCTDPDDDGDGEPDGSDCDPLDPAAFPGATEVCDAVDQDCDGDLVETFTDTDGDGLPDCAEYDTDGDGDPDETDCSPLDDSIFTGAEEIADDGIDQDCDGADTVTCFEDLDEDGYGSVDTVLAADGDCDDPGESNLATDCDDDDEQVHPGASETCNGGVDDDCDPATDETVDGDGDGYSICDGDCDDAAETVFPGAEEACDGLDNDCDPDTVEDEADEDGDGHRVCDGDCADGDDLVYPGAPELCDDIDNDCDGDVDEELEYVDWYEDVDGDGYGDENSIEIDCIEPEGYVAAGGDCDDSDPAINPGAEEDCDGIDNDCDPATDLDGTDHDADGDGALACDGDCDDDDPEAFTGATENCDDDIDQDCDGAEAGGEDPECWSGGCSDCASSLGSAPPAPLALLLLLSGALLFRGRTTRPLTNSERP